jgi:SAM-dependent MidA family methyltransferase
LYSTSLLGVITIDFIKTNIQNFRATLWSYSKNDDFNRHIFFLIDVEMQLSEIIIQRIKNEGPIPFRDFMEMALYYPQLGYYTSAKDKIGKQGDYYTSCTLSPVYGALIARQLEEMWVLSGSGAFTIVEYGAGTGALCKAILDSLKSKTAFYEQLKYCIIEKSQAMRELEQTQFPEKVSWHNSIETIPNLHGCVLSNELVDNFAVHRVVMQDELMEVFVDYKNEFIDVLKPASQELKAYLDELNVTLAKGFRTEINLEATAWMKEIAASLKKGYVITIDYGFPSHELYEDYRKRGTLLCYHKHRVNEQPYNFIGQQDITAHVNFSALCLWGHKHGLDFCGYTNQAKFLQSLGFNNYLEQTAQPGQDCVNFKREFFLTNTLLRDMGNAFKVLIQQKQMPAQGLLGLSHQEAA